MEETKRKSLELIAKHASERLRVLEAEGIIPKGIFPIASIAFMGRPGAGKGFQTSRIARIRPLLPHSSGASFRDYVINDCPEIKDNNLLLYEMDDFSLLSKENIKAVMSGFGLVDDFTTMNLVFRSLCDTYSDKFVPKDGFLGPDGYPRNTAQYFLTQPFIDIKGAVELVADDEVRMQRLFGRKEEEQREDDKDPEKALLERDRIYLTQTEPVYEMIRQQPDLVHVMVEVNHPEKEENFKRVLPAYDSVVSDIVF
jgi:adenylate kinase family enzyme